MLGVRASEGGKHPGRGTRNALIALSESSYLEIVGPDPEQPWTGDQRWFRIDSLTRPRLVTWAAKATELPKLVAGAMSKGIEFGPVITGSRRRTGGVLLEWQFTDPKKIVADGIVPFFIDWGKSPHPALSAPRGPDLLSLTAQHPEPDTVARILAELNIPLKVTYGATPLLTATFCNNCTF